MKFDKPEQTRVAKPRESCGVEGPRGKRGAMGIWVGCGG